MSQRVNNPFFLRQIVEYVQKRIGRKLVQDELPWVRNFVQEHVPQRMYLSNIQMAQQARAMGDIIARRIATSSQQEEVPDIQELLKDILATDGYGTQTTEGEVTEPTETTNASTDVEQILDIKNFYELALTVQPRAVYGAKHLLLDTKTRENPGDRFSFRWSTYNQAQQGPGIVTFPGTLIDIVVIRVFGFYAPVPERLTLRQEEFNRRVFMRIDEFASQGFYGPNRSQFQVPLGVDPRSETFDTRLLRVFAENRGWFRAGNPITRLDTITVRFYGLSTNIEMPPERQSCNIQWLPGVPTRFQFTIPEINPIPGSPYVLKVGDAVQFEKYIIPPNLSGYFSNWITRVGGHQILSVINNQTYEAAGPPTSGVFPPPYSGTPDETSAECIIVKRLVTIPIQIIYRRPEEEMEM